MAKLKLGAIPDDKPVKLTIMLTAEQHALLVEYAELHSRQFNRRVPPEKLVPHMLERFISTDRVFARARRRNTEARIPSHSVSRGEGRE